MVELKNGSISVESELGKGTSFTILLPYEPASDKSLHEESNQHHVITNKTNNLKDMKVLLTEDNQINQLVTADLLKEEGAQVVIANHGKEAIEQLEEQDFDVVLMDMQMPIMDGYEAMQHIRNKMTAPQQHIPILALTAHVTEGEIEKCKTAGADDYLSKPFNPKDLYAKIKGLYEGTLLNDEVLSEKDEKEPLTKGEIKEVMDISKLKEFTNNKPQLMVSTINVLIEELPNDITLMETALKDKDWERLRSISHRIKPNFMLIAKAAIYENVILIEKYAKEEINLNELPELVEQLKKNTPSLIEELKVEVNKL